MAESFSSFTPSKKSSVADDPVTILNVTFDNLTMREFLQQLKSGVVLTPNTDHLMRLQRDGEFFKLYQLADYRVCDSQVLMYAAQFLGTPLKEKISGSDLFPAFCNFHRKNEDISIFLLGAAPGVADKARARINHRIGREIVIGSHSPSYGFEKNEQECLEIVDIINQSGATVLAVGVGSPKQEKWIFKYKDKLPNVKIFMAIGATIDFEAGTLQRAPKWISMLGMEWVFRITQDPKRLWRRYLLEDLPIVGLLLKQKLGLYTSPFATSSELMPDLPGVSKLQGRQVPTQI
jgi:exopolysaccharide biosynthesis WecB/TagA/CpsF family protein